MRPGPSSQTSGMQPEPSSSAPAVAAFPLLSLPHAVLAQHVWPLLSPWGRAQLRATCKELRQLSDGLLEGTMQFHVTAELSKTTAHGRPQTRKATQQQGSVFVAAALQQALEQVKVWEAKCRLLARCPRVQTLALQMNAALPPDKLQQLCAAAGGRLTCLKLDMQELTTHSMRNTLALIPSLCPELRELNVVISHNQHSQSITTIPAPVGLPAPLESLSLVLHSGDAARIWPAVAGSLGAATQLTRLHSLKVNLGNAGPQVDVSPLVPIASHLTRLYVSWGSRMRSGVAGLPQLLAACSSSLTSLALPVYVAAAPDQPSLAQVLTAAPNLQQLEVLPDDVPSFLFHPIEPPAAADIQALRTHPTLRRLVVHSTALCEQLAAAALPPGSLQHMQIELGHWDGSSAEELLQLLSVVSLSAGCRLVYDDVTYVPWFHLGRPPLDADLLSRLAQAIRSSGVQIVREVGAGGGGQAPGAAAPTGPGVLRFDFGGPLEQPSDQQAVAGLLGSLPGLCITQNGQLSTQFCQEAEAVGAGSSGGLWLLPALARTTCLSLSYNCSDELPRFAAALSIA